MKKLLAAETFSRCIYCGEANGLFSTKEHFFSESLGGGEWATLPAGLVCDKCQRYFGTKVEKAVLSDWPFNFVRFMMAVPTKKRKSVQIDTELGQLTACKLPGYSQVNAKDLSALDDARKFRRTTIPASPQEPRLICRALVKMAIGSLASSKSEDVFARRIETARRFARFGDSTITWWYLERIDLKKMRKALNFGAGGNREPIKVETIYVDNIPAFFHLTYYFLDIMTPIERHFEMDLPQELPEGTHIYRV